MIAIFGRTRPSRSGLIDGFVSSIVFGVLAMSLAILAVILLGLTELPADDVLSWVVVLSTALGLSQVIPSHGRDPLVSMVSVTFMLVHFRSWLFVSPPPLGEHTQVIRLFLSVPAFVMVGILAGAWLAPSLRLKEERLPAAILGLAGTIGWWTLLAFGSLDQIEQLPLRAMALVVCCAAAGVSAVSHVWLRRRRAHRYGSEILIGAATWAYFVGDICSSFFADESALFDGNTAMVMARLLICVLLSVAAIMSIPDGAGLPLARGRDRFTFAVALLSPGILSIVPLIAWVSAGTQPPSWFAPVWVGGTLLLVTGLALAVVASPDAIKRKAVKLPELSRCQLHYQPIVRSTDGVMIGAEALFRIEQPDGMGSGGWVFEQLAGSDRLPELTNWVMDEAFRDGRELLRRFDDPEAFVSINMSPEEFMAPGLIGRIDESLERLGTTAEGFMVEITELSFMGGTDTVNELVDQLHDRGFMVALDDFGTGYASLHSIVDVDFDLVKIDRSMVVSADRPRGEQVLGRTIELLSASGLLVLAEGVETDHQARRVISQKPHFVQGYATGVPMPFEDLLATLV